MAAAQMEDVLQEIEAMKAVYGSDCVVLQEFPPHVRVNIKPRTADDISQQFVEAILVIKANAQYPMELPEVELVDTKGLDEARHSCLLMEVHNVAKDFEATPMLVALCEAAIERLSDMNHPEGDCAFCLFPLAIEDDRSGARPFMKLMSCFHCFHRFRARQTCILTYMKLFYILDPRICWIGSVSNKFFFPDCFASWWQWLQKQSNFEENGSSVATVAGQRETENDGEYSGSRLGNRSEEKFTGHCPICRKVIHGGDIEHVRLLLTSDINTNMEDEEIKIDYNPSIDDIKRREAFAELYLGQKERGGIIEPKKPEVILPGMFLPLVANAAGMQGSRGQETSLAEETLNNEAPSTSSTNISHKESNHGRASNSRRAHSGRPFRNRGRAPNSQRQSHDHVQSSKTGKGIGRGKSLWVKKD